MGTRHSMRVVDADYQYKVGLSRRGISAVSFGL
jgi:hypothetical protein